MLENARRKARAGLRAARGGARGAVVLGVDTEVALDGRLLGKPADAAGAASASRRSPGAPTRCSGGVGPAGRRAAKRAPAARSPSSPATRSPSAGSRSESPSAELDPAHLDLYSRSGEWRDRAGAYAIQGLGSILIERIEGDFSNVVGLPVGAASSCPRNCSPQQEIPLRGVISPNPQVYIEFKSVPHPAIEAASGFATLGARCGRCDARLRYAWDGRFEARLDATIRAARATAPTRPPPEDFIDLRQWDCFAT